MARGDDADVSGRTRSPGEDLAFPDDRGVADEAPVLPNLYVVRQRDTQRAEVPGEHADERGYIAARVEKAWKQRKGREGDDGAALHPGAGAQFGAASQDDRPPLHLEA